MTDFNREAALAAADGTRDAVALLLAMLDNDQEAQDVILFNGDPMLTTVSLAGFVFFAIPDRGRLHQLVTAWRQAAET